MLVDGQTSGGWARIGGELRPAAALCAGKDQGGTMIIDAGEPGRDARSGARDDGWIAGEFVAPAAGWIDESLYRQADAPGATWLMTYSGSEADH